MSAIDLAIASDRRNDTLAIFKIDPTTRQLTNITADNIAQSIFGMDDGEKTAYGLATYTSPVSGLYVFVSQHESNQVAQLELVADATGEIGAKLVRTLMLPIPSGGEAAAQIEGMVADHELGYLYVGQEQVGIWKFAIEPQSSTRGVLIDAVKPVGSNLTADVEGLTIYYAADGQGYLLASSQGDNTFAAYSRGSDNAYLGSFAVGEFGKIDGVEASDGADVINVPLGSDFAAGMLVVQDGNNDPAVPIAEDGELENASSNFKFIPWENVANALPEALQIDTTSYNPRDSFLNTINGTADADNLVGTYQTDRINGFAGNDTITGALNNDLLTGGGGQDMLAMQRGDGIDTITIFGGVGIKTQPTLIIVAEIDTIQFQGSGLDAKNMLLSQIDDDLLIEFEHIDDTKLILANFNLENLENLKNSLGNIIFERQNQLQDSFDIFNADSQRHRVFNLNRVTFLNNLDNHIAGFERSDDVINGQGGADKIAGLSSDDLLRGGTGNDTLIGGQGSDRLVGDAGEDMLMGGRGADLFVIAADAGLDTIADFDLRQHDRIELSQLSFEQLAIAPGIGSNANNTILSAFGQDIAIVLGLEASNLSRESFLFD